MIYTFYSYKGGVGRTMALANMAELFYQAGMNVLMVDWDLEAPGLERFFPTLLQGNILQKRGIMDMLLQYKVQMSQELPDSEKKPISLLESPKELIVDVYRDNPSEAKLWFLPSGKRSDEHFTTYANAVLTFDWQDFYQNWEGERYFDWLREEFEQIADVILIDSRTGVTEMGGVCTYQLADIIVMCCATNQQNLEGIYKMAHRFKRPELIPLRRGRPLEVFIVPARLENAEGNSLNQFKRDFIKRFEEFVPETLGDSAERLWELGIPYIPYYAYNERVAVRERGEAIAESIIESFENLASALNPTYSPSIKSSPASRIPQSSNPTYRQGTKSVQPTAKVVILTTLEVEYMAVRAHLTDLKEETHPSGTVYERGSFIHNSQKWEVGIVEIGAGNPPAALEAERAIHYFDPSVVFFVGVAGGIKDVKLGDVVVATKVYGYESGKVGEGFKARPEVGNSSYALVQRARSERRKKNWLQRLDKNGSQTAAPVFVGPIAAGEKVVASKRSSLSEFLRLNYNDALAVEMEGHSFLKGALANQHVKALIVRGISDLIDGKSEADRAGWQEIASHHASAFAFEVLAKSSISSRHITSNEINTTNSAILFDELAEWTHVHDDVQQILDALDRVFDNLNEYRFKENQESLYRASFDWQRRCVPALTFVFRKWNLQHAYTLEFDRLREKIADMDSITLQIMKDVDSQQFRTLYFWFIELKSLLWNILTVANMRILVLVNTLRSPVRR